MSEIDDLGKRLVKDSQDRRDKMRRRQERYEKKTAIASLVLPIGAKIIEDRLTQKAQDFFNQEEVLNLKRQHTKANREASSIFSLRDAISQSSKTDEEYFYDQVYGTVESETLSAANARQQDEGINIVGRHVQSGDMLNQELMHEYLNFLFLLIFLWLLLHHDQNHVRSKQHYNLIVHI